MFGRYHFICGQLYEKWFRTGYVREELPRDINLSRLEKIAKPYFPNSVTISLTQHGLVKYIIIDNK